MSQGQKYFTQVSVVPLPCLHVLLFERKHCTLRMSETRKEVFAVNFSCSAFASESSCSSLSTFASASILCKFAFRTLELFPQPTYLFENIFLDFDEGCLLVSALSSLHKLVCGFSHSIARLFQPLHALRPSVGLHLDSLVTSHIRANHIMNNFPLSPGTRALTGLLPC